MSETITFLVGLPACGKSTYAEKLKITYGEDDTIIVESDAYRERFYGDPAIQGDNNKLFEIIHGDILKHLSEGYNVIFDATNLSRKNRVALLQKVPSNVIKECIVIATSYVKCIERNNLRDRKVPAEVIDRMWKSFQVPTYTEGYDVIDIEYDYDKKDYKIEEYLLFADDFDQKNYHHKLTLGQHSRKVSELLENSSVDEWVRLAGLLHDCGKPMTQVFSDMKGKPSDIAHYYSHENCGAYEAMFYLDRQIFRAGELLDAITLINYHMRPYMATTEKAKEKLKNIVGEDLYYFLMLLHQADKEAH